MKRDSKITLFRNYFNPDPVADLSIFEFCDYVKNSPEFVKEITSIRDPKVSKDKRDRIKATLPAVTISGTFTKRQADSLIMHSGFICLDLDQGKNDVTDWPMVRDSLMDCENVYFAALSASARGVFCLVPIAYPHKHKQQAVQLLKDFEKATGLSPDQSCKDVCRLRGISHDPDAKYNESVIKYYGVHLDVKKSYPGSTSNISPLATAQRMIREATEGERHDSILRASILVGGYVAAGIINEHEAQSLLISEAKDKLPPSRHREAEKTIVDGIRHGKTKPIT